MIYAIVPVLLLLGLFLAMLWERRQWGVCSLKTRLDGKAVIVTGGNVGLGAQTGLKLAGRGATVVLACRSEERGQRTVDWIKRKTGNEDIHYKHLDLASFQSVRGFAREVLEEYPSIFCLVCNAGVAFPMELHKKTDLGLEIHAAVNHLGHFLLTNLLIDGNHRHPLRTDRNPRVVMVASHLASQALLDFDKFDHFKEGRQSPTKTLAPTGYCDSKLMNILFSNLLFKLVEFLFFKSSSEGAETILHAVLEDKENVTEGGFYKDCKLAVEENDLYDSMSETGKHLWQLSRDLTGLKN